MRNRLLLLSALSISLSMFGAEASLSEKHFVTFPTREVLKTCFAGKGLHDLDAKTNMTDIVSEILEPAEVVMEVNQKFRDYTAFVRKSNPNAIFGLIMGEDEIKTTILQILLQNDPAARAVLIASKCQYLEDKSRNDERNKPRNNGQNSWCSIS